MRRSIYMLVALFSLFALSIFNDRPATAQEDASDAWGTFTFISYACTPDSMYTESGLWTSNPAGNPHPDDIGIGCASSSSLFTIVSTTDSTLAFEVNTSLTSTSDPLPTGDYTVTDQSSGLSVTATIGENGATTTIFAIVAIEAEGEIPAGTVHIFSYDCMTDRGDFMVGVPDAFEGCEVVSNMPFTVYQYGDASGEPIVTLTTDTDGRVFWNLPVGDYQVVAEESQMKLDITVVAGETVYLGYDVVGSATSENPTSEPTVASTAVPTAPSSVAVTGLPATGTGSPMAGGNAEIMGTVAAFMASAIVYVGALGLRKAIE